MISFKHKGDLSKTTNFLKRARDFKVERILNKYGKLGVSALMQDTPRDTGETAKSWDYEIEESNGELKLVFFNSNVNRGVNIALLIQYGHGTGTGGWVEGRDYINPSLRPIFDELAEKLWKEVTGK